LFVCVPSIASVILQLQRVSFSRTIIQREERQMPNVYGMDTSDFPGHAVLGWYWANCGFRYTGFYVAPAPRHPNQSWMSQRDELAAAGWGFLPVYVGLQINASGLSTANGAQHGNDAATLMTNAKFHAQTICYLDLEDGTEPSGNYAGYISAWVTALQSEGCVPGIYCSHHRRLVPTASKPRGKRRAKKPGGTKSA